MIAYLCTLLFFNQRAELPETMKSSDAELKNKTTGFQDMLDYIWEIPYSSDKPLSTADLIILGHTYKLIKEVHDQVDTKQADLPDVSQIEESTYVHCGLTGNNRMLENDVFVEEPVQSTPFDNIKLFFNKISAAGHDALNHEELANISYPDEFLNDLNTKLWFTYRSGFPLIERDKNGPSSLSIGSILRCNLNMANISKGFTTDSGWGCMVRTSQSLLANALVILKLGRNWDINSSTPDQMLTHWEIVSKFADVPEADFSIHNYVLYAAKYCGKKPGEWFGPSNAAKSIQKLCEEHAKLNDLKVYISSDSGDIFEDEITRLSSSNIDKDFTPILILCGVRLGVQNINSIYWDFLKLCLQMSYSVGISGGRPSSSHYFLGFQDDYLFYFDPHIPQPAILLDESGEIDVNLKLRVFDTIHTTKVRRLHINKVDPSMLIGFLIKSKDDYNDFKEKIMSFDSNKRFLNIYDRRPRIKSFNSAGSELDGFIDLGVDELDEEDAFDAAFTESEDINTGIPQLVSEVTNKCEDKETDMEIVEVDTEKSKELIEYEKLDVSPLDDSLVEVENYDIPIHIEKENEQVSDDIVDTKETMVFVTENNLPGLNIVSTEVLEPVTTSTTVS